MAVAVKLLDVPVESFKFYKEARIREVAVHDSDRIKFIQRSHQPVAGVFYSLEMPGSDKACRPDQYEVFHRVAKIRYT